MGKGDAFLPSIRREKNFVQQPQKQQVVVTREHNSHRLTSGLNYSTKKKNIDQKRGGNFHKTAANPNYVTRAILGFQQFLKGGNSLKNDIEEKDV